MRRKPREGWSQGRCELADKKIAKSRAKRVHSDRCRIGNIAKLIIADPFSYVKHEAKLTNIALQLLSGKDAPNKLPDSVRDKVWGCNLLDVSSSEMDHILSLLGIHIISNKELREYEFLLRVKLTYGIYTANKRRLQAKFDRLRNDCGDM